MNEIERMLMDDIREQKMVARGYHNKASANGGTRGKAITMASLMYGFELSPCKVTRNGREVEIPSSWMTKAGAIKKSKREAFEALFL